MPTCLKIDWSGLRSVTSSETEQTCAYPAGKIHNGIVYTPSRPPSPRLPFWTYIWPGQWDTIVRIHSYPKRLYTPTTLMSEEIKPFASVIDGHDSCQVSLFWCVDRLQELNIS